MKWAEEDVALFGEGMDEVGVLETNTGIYMIAVARKRGQHSKGFRTVLGFAEHLVVMNHHGIGCDENLVGSKFLGRESLGLE